MDHSKNKQRRYSFSATRAMVARMGLKGARLDPVDNLTNNSGVVHGRRASLPEKAMVSVPLSDNVNQPQDKQDQRMSISDDRTVRRGGKSWKDILRLWKKEKIIPPSISIKKSETDSNIYKPKPTSGVCIRVVVTEINPQAYYKTLEINRHTTVFEVIVKLIQKYAFKDEDRDPNEVYLTEVREGYQGSYSRVLSNNDLVYEIQSKWDAEEECYFALYGAHLSETRASVDPSIEDMFEPADVHHMMPMIISPSQDSFYNSFPDIGTTVLPHSYIAPPSLNSTTPPTFTTTNQDPSSFPGISSHILNSKLTISPSEKSGNFETSAFELPTTTTLHSQQIEHGLKYVNLSDPKIEADIEYAWEVDTPIEEDESGPSYSGWREDTKAAQRHQMHESINTGMQEIMAKVVLETKWNSPRRKKIHSCWSSTKLITTKSTLLTPVHDTIIYNLLCSPIAPKKLNRKSYPDFKFPPSPDYGISDEEEDLPVSDPHRKSGTMDGIIDIREQDEHAVRVFDFNTVSNFVENYERNREVEREEEEDEEVVAEEGYSCKFMTEDILSDVDASPIQHLTTIHRELNNVHAPAEARSHLEKCMVVGIKHTTSSTFIPTGFHKQCNKMETEFKPPSISSDKKISPASKIRNMPSTIQSSSRHSLSTDRNMQATLPLRRSHTIQHKPTTSVTINRAHARKLSTDDSRANDIMKDEVFGKATLRGMMKKPRSQEYLHTSVIRTTSNILRDNIVQYPTREIVTDLDHAVSNKEKKRCQHPFHTEISTTSTSRKQYVLLRERKAILNGVSRISKRSASMVSRLPNGGSIQDRYDSLADSDSCREDQIDGVYI